MPSRGRKFITEFLLPSLNEKRFGLRLMWLDIEKKVFQMQWNHKSASDWTTSDAAVFAAWDKRKGHYKPDDKEYYTKSKQRFRAALYKFIKYKHITELYSEDKYTKIYCIGDGKNISGTYIAIKNEKENDRNENTSQKVKHNPKDVLNLNDIWNEDIFVEPEGNSLIVYDNHEIKKGYSIDEEQVVTDCTSELNLDLLYPENSQDYILPLNSLSGNKKNFFARETSNVLKESDKLLHFISETDICKKDNLPKIEVTIANNFHDYLSTEKKNTSRGKEWPITALDEQMEVSNLVCHFLHTYNY